MQRCRPCRWPAHVRSDAISSWVDMFTGLIEDVGSVAGVEASAAGKTLTFETALQGIAPGDSVSVNGVCLTAVAVGGGRISAHLGPETLRVTTLGEVRRGDRVNLERAMRADARFGGHFVQGHVDGVGSIEDVREDGDSRWLRITYPAAARAYLIPKGAVAVDGVSLTVASLAGATFDVMIVPFTWQHTALPARRVGDPVNLEFDMIGKYVARAAELAGPTRQP